MDYFVDNDILHKLARTNLLHELPRILDCHILQIYALDTAKYYFGIKKPEAAKQKWGESAYKRIQDFLDKCSVICDLPSPEAESALSDITGIETGEAMLYGVAAFRKNTIVISGDKKGMRSLSSNLKCEVIAKALKGRMLSLEQLILRFIDRDGCERVQDAIMPEIAVDGMLRLVFGATRKPEHHVRDGLDSHIKELRGFAVDLLHSG